MLENCVRECVPYLRFNNDPAVTPYINSGTPVLVYGVITDVRWTCQTSEIIAYFQSAVPSPCIVGVEEQTWGRVKSLYR
jgi:hypothetical protein